jgi:hypothetical protein
LSDVEFLGGVVQAAITVIGGAVALSVLWKHGPGGEIHDIKKSATEFMDTVRVEIHGIRVDMQKHQEANRKDLQQHRDSILLEQMSHDKRLSYVEFALQAKKDAMERHDRRQEQELERLSQGRKGE